MADGAIKASWPGLSGPSRRPSASTQASAKSLATGRLPAGRAEAGLVLAAARRRWPDKPGHDGKGSTNEQQTGRPTDNAIRAKIRLLSPWLLWARNGEPGGGGGRRHQGVMAGLVPAIAEGPAHLRRQARKALRPSPAFLPVAPRRDSFLRRPGVDGRDKPGHDGKGSTNEQQTGRPTHNAIRAKIRALIALAVVGKEWGAWRRWRTSHQGVMAGLVPGHPRRTSASTQASAKSLATVPLPAGRAEAELVLAAARRGWPGQAGHDGTGSTNEQQTGRPTDNATRAIMFEKVWRAAVCSRPRPASTR